MIRALFDANIVVAFYTARGGSLSELQRRQGAGAYTVVVSRTILDEAARTWAKPYWQARLSRAERDLLVRLVESQCEVIPVSVEVIGIASHPEDDLVLAAAVSGRVDTLVTGDRQLLKLEVYEGIAILNPRQFLSLLEGE